MQETFFSAKAKETAFGLAKIEEGKTAADIGAGTGYITGSLIERKIKVFAVDQSQEMLDYLLEKYKGKGEFVCLQGDGSKLPLADESVDYVFANMYLHHTESPLIAIKEMFRILKKEGKMVITDLDSHNHEFLREEQHDKWLGFERMEIKKWLQEIGFSKISIQSVGAECSAKAVCSCDSANIGIFAVLGIKQFL